MASPDIAKLLKKLHKEFLPLKKGAIANYIPELAKASADTFAISIVTTKGQIYSIGDWEGAFTIQSISKPFTYGLALQKYDRDFVRKKVGTEPTGDSFNSIISLDRASKRPHNPMENAGAIAIASILKGKDPTEGLNDILNMFRAYAGHNNIHIDNSVFMSEKTHGHRNRAIAHLMLHFDMLDNEITHTLDLYFQQCSILMNTQDLATVAATLANYGTNPITKDQIIDKKYIQDILTIMFTCGLYDAAGTWANNVGMPAKSGVGGGIIAVAPGEMGIAVYSPPLNEHGNSVRGMAVCEAISEELGLHLFAH